MTDIGFQAIIAPEIAAFVEPIDGAKPHPDNVRKHRIEKIAQSLEAHGQRTPIVVQQSTGYIVKGNGTWEAARLLGWSEIAMIRQDMGDTEALEYLFADNRASDLSSYQREKLHSVLSRLVGEGSLTGTLWEEEEFQDLEEEFTALTTLPDTGMGADKAEAEEGESAPAPMGTKMREVPLVLNSEDHAMFLDKIRVLQQSFGTSGSIATILEAVKRQAEAEEGVVETGALITDAMRNEIVNATLDDIRLVLATMPLMLTRQNVQDMITKMYREVPREAVAEGQVEAFA